MSKTKRLRRALRKYIRLHWSVRCKSTDIDCACCRAWQAYDLLRGQPCLLENIIDKYARETRDHRQG